MKILIVDDETEYREMVTILLEHYGYETVAVNNGLLALQKLEQDRFDLLISDILMPQMDGYQLCREIKRRAELRHIPIIIYTGTYTEGKDEALIRQLGADQFLTKPLTTERLLSNIRELLPKKPDAAVECQPAQPQDRMESEEAFLRAYNERVLDKLEHKVAELEALSRKFQAALAEKDREVAERLRAEEALRQSQSELEHRVEERTAELASANANLRNEIAERKQAEAALRESEKRYRALVEYSPDGIVVTVDEHLVFGNRTAARIVGASKPEDLSGRSIWDFFHEDYHELLRQRRAQMLATGVPTPATEVRLRRLDGALTDVEGIAAPVSLGGRIAIHQSFRDITERKRMEAELAKARDEALASVRSKAEFLANMSHEIRTPMNGVIGMTSLLLDTQLTAPQREYTETIRNCGELLLNLINDILDFSKIEARKLTFEMLDFNLREVVEGTLELLADRARSKGLELAGLVPPELPYLLQGDSGRLRQILTNLVANAIKFTERGEVIARVALAHETETQAKLRFEVQDTGIGISTEEQQRLFQVFSQADGSITRKYGGTGLGLAICKQLTDIMGGEIGVESAVGKGSTFWFTVQLGKQPPAAAALGMEKQDLAHLRVLIVDDNATNRQILERHAGAWQMRTRSAASGREAWQILHQEPRESFDLAILDLQMPALDGITLARMIKADPLTSHIRLILTSSLGQQIGAAELDQAGIEGYLAKPLKQARFYDCIAQMMGRKRSPTAAPEKPLAPTEKPWRKARVLLAEDNAINQRVALSQLKKLGYQADVAANGLEVLDAIRRIPYDLILMDCQMPDMDGYEATRQVRLREQAQASGREPIHIIAMTAHAMLGDREKCLEAGMNDYLSKPVNTEALRAALDRFQAAHEPSGAKPPPPEAPSLNNAVAPPEEFPVNPKRLHEVSDGDPKQRRQIIELYLSEAETYMRQLQAAIEAGSTDQMERIAHAFVGASALLGATGMIAPLKALERAGKEGAKAGAEGLLAEARKAYNVARAFLIDDLRKLPLD